MGRRSEPVRPLLAGQSNGEVRASLTRGDRATGSLAVLPRLSRKEGKARFLPLGPSMFLVFNRGIEYFLLNQKNSISAWRALANVTDAEN